MEGIASLRDGTQGVRYPPGAQQSILQDFQRNPRSQVDHYPRLITTGRDMHNLNAGPIQTGAAAMNNPAYFSNNELFPDAPLPFFRQRNGGQFNTDWHLPSGLFRQNRHETFSEELHGPPSCRYNPEVYGNANIDGRIRNYTSLADKNRIGHGAYNDYIPLDDEYPGAEAIKFRRGGAGPFPGGPNPCSVKEGFGNGMQKTERRRVNYDLARIPYSEELLRGLVLLNPPIENVFPNRHGGAGAPYLAMGSLYNPQLHMPSTYGGPGQKHYWRNEGVDEVNAHFPIYRPKFIGKQMIYPEFGESNSVMRPQARAFTENGVRTPAGLYGIHN
jgi:hypothetical protein